MEAQIQGPAEGTHSPGDPGGPAEPWKLPACPPRPYWKGSADVERAGLCPASQTQEAEHQEKQKGAFLRPRCYGNPPLAARLWKNRHCLPGPRSRSLLLTSGSGHDPEMPSQRWGRRVLRALAHERAWHLPPAQPQGRGDKKPKERFPRNSLAAIITAGSSSSFP